MSSETGSSTERSFGPTHVIEPSLEHTHTAIMLHGRGSNGPEFAEELAETATPGQKPLVQRFPGWRWVFPSSQELWSTAFEEMLPAWFEAHSLTDPTERQDLQMEGIRRSVTRIKSIIGQEAARLSGRTERIVIAGISQGGAIGMWALLCQENLNKRFGAFVGASTWLPFAVNIERFLGRGDAAHLSEPESEANPSDAFVWGMMFSWSRAISSPLTRRPLLSTPILLGHGVDDAFVDVDLGREARRVLANVGFQVDWQDEAADFPFPTPRAPMDAFETSKPDRFHQSLSSAWASFLNAQHCSQEVNALRKTLHEHIQKTTLSITSLKEEATQQHDILSGKIEEHDVQLKEGFSVLEQKVTGDSEIASTKFIELSEKAVTQQEGLDALRVATCQDIRAIQDQYRSALERINLLEGELREIRAGKMASDQKLAVLECQINTMNQAHQELSEDMVNLLDRILSRREELMRLLDTQAYDKPEEPVQQPTKRPGPSYGLPTHDVPSDNPTQDIRSLYLIFRDRHKANPPKSDTAFIWEFLSSIEDPTMSKHIQESLASILPEYVTASRDTRRRNPRRHVDISRGLTWRKFREALVKIPGPS
ncbi:Alpha/Beta hydrolase protein [Achaetomium macrosporum]|uniref:Alpha/Beta hydrolase protein n=1 Tax=Achaetomium macrosporum TaxID=79813 RepID=A0AAN7HGY6_9PEZI|nr:Alpha/Beta hydrolase protein [Achaetomium macrosporum]